MTIINVYTSEIEEGGGGKGCFCLTDGSSSCIETTSLLLRPAVDEVRPATILEGSLFYLLKLWSQV